MEFKLTEWLARVRMRLRVCLGALGGEKGGENYWIAVCLHLTIMMIGVFQYHLQRLWLGYPKYFYLIAKCRTRCTAFIKYEMPIYHRSDTRSVCNSKPDYLHMKWLRLTKPIDRFVIDSIRRPVKVFRIYFVSVQYHFTETVFRKTSSVRLWFLRWNPTTITMTMTTTKDKILCCCCFSWTWDATNVVDTKDNKAKLTRLNAQCQMLPNNQLRESEREWESFRRL